MKIALVGNPNVGKSLLFNQLTGLNQKTGNYPGITVEKNSGFLDFNNQKFEIIDFPGIYSLYPKSIDEQVVYDILIDENNEDYPDLIILITEFNSLKRGLFLYQQLRNLDIPILLVINQIDNFSEQDSTQLQKNIQEVLDNKFSQKVAFISAKTNFGIENLKQLILHKTSKQNTEFELPKQYEFLKEEFKDSKQTIYKNWIQISQSSNKNTEFETIKIKHKLIPKRLQVAETLKRYHISDEIIQEINYSSFDKSKKISNKIDSFVLNPILGYIIFLFLMFIVFQLLFSFSSYPMTFIENTFTFFTSILTQYLPEGPLFSLITNGIMPGISGIMVFVPQIALLFFFILLMEQSGYMSRVVFIMDRFMKPFGLSGKSMIPLLSGVACAVPAIMSARNIENPKERLLTILVTPFMTCSARLPVYSILIALVVPKTTYFGMNLQGIVLMGMYLLGIFTALISALILKKVTFTKQKSYLVIDMPNYRIPQFSLIFSDVFSRCKEFIFGAGKIIFAVSILLWALSSFSPETSFKNWEAPKIENSYLGIIGKGIEPVIRPLGYDWKIGIGIVSSVAAREVFVGTMKIIYNLEEHKQDKIVFINTFDFIKKMTAEIFNFNENNAQDNSLINQMRKDVFLDNHLPIYSLATGISLMIFYAFAMQCISTIAVVKQETKSMKWAFFQFSAMTLIAYFSAWFVYYLLS